jgi:cyclic pyranopterin phosphate synthase
MPIGNSQDWSKDSFITGQQVLDIISKAFTLTKLEKNKYDGPSLDYRLSNGAKIGIITPLSNHFCGSCDKLRLTSDGKLRPCLLSDAEIDLFPTIKQKNTEKLLNLVEDSLNIKNWSHHIADCQSISFNRTMSKIGG